MVLLFRTRWHQSHTHSLASRKYKKKEKHQASPHANKNLETRNDDTICIQPKQHCSKYMLGHLFWRTSQHVHTHPPQEDFLPQKQFLGLCKDYPARSSCTSILETLGLLQLRNFSPSHEETTTSNGLPSQVGLSEGYAINLNITLHCQPCFCLYITLLEHCEITRACTDDVMSETKTFLEGPSSALSTNKRFYPHRPAHHRCCKTWRTYTSSEVANPSILLGPIRLHDLIKRLLKIRLGTNVSCF